jgi:SAM-dependent methyltransferase
MSPSIIPRFYEAQYASFSEDLPWWLSVVAGCRGPILELGCGAGRVLAVLAQAGFEIDGLDHEPEMLRRAQRRLHGEVRSRVRLVEGDLSRLLLDRRYARILIPCNTFAEMDEASAEAALADIQRHLLPDGRLAAELPTPSEILGETVDPSEPLDEFIEPETGHPVQVYAEHHQDPDGKLVQVVWHYDELHPDGTVIRSDASTSFHLWTLERLVEATARAGFASLEVFGNYDRSPFTLESPRLLFVASASDARGSSSAGEVVG